MVIEGEIDLENEGDKVRDLLMRRGMGEQKETILARDRKPSRG